MRRTLFIAIALVALGGGIAYYQLGAEAAPTLVTASVTRGPVVQKVEATGTVQPVDSVEVGSQVTGTINHLGATFNSVVRAGQVLATLDPASLQAQVDQARAALARMNADLLQANVTLSDAQIKLDRAERLSKEQLIPQADLDAARVARDGAQAGLKSAEAQVVQGRASLSQAQVNVAHTIIKSPTDGIVLSRNVEVGQTVTSGLQTPTLFVIARDLEHDAGRRQRRRVRHRPRRRRAAGDVHARRIWRRDVHRQGHRGATAARGDEQRRDLHDDHHGAESRAEAEAGHDRDRAHRDRP